MRQVVYSMGMSLDGYISDPDGGIDWGAPSDEVFRFSIDEIRGIGVHLLGRRMYEIMRYWDDAEHASGFSADEREWADLWNPLPKVVFSRTLESVDASARLAETDLAGEIERLRAEPLDGDIAIAGADLAVQAAGLDLIDEYSIRVFPVLIGGGTPYFAHVARQVDLELLDTRVFDSGVLHLRYRVRH